MRIATLTGLFLMCALIATAQVIQQDRLMSLGTHPALVLEIKNADVKTVESVWKSFFGNFGRDKKNRKADEYYITDAEIGPLRYSRAVDLYATISGSGPNVTVVTWIDMKGGFISAADYPEQYREAVKLLQDFDLNVRKTVIEEELKENEKLLSRLDNDLKKLIRQNESLHKTIEDAKAKIAKAEEEIVVNLADQDTKKKEIEVQQKTVQEIVQKLKNLVK